MQGNGDIYGPASMIAYGCRGGTFELTLIAKGSPVTVRLDNGHSHAGAGAGPRGDLARVRPGLGPEGVCTLAIAPSGIVGSTRFEYVPGF